MFTVQKTDASTIQIMDNGGQDQASLSSVNVTAPAAFTMTDFNSASVISSTTTAPFTALSVNPPTVGSSLILTPVSGNWAASTQITVVGNFNDGSQQIILQSTV